MIEPKRAPLPNSGQLELEFAHRYITDTSFGDEVNGGRLEIQIDGGPWTDWEDAGGTFSQNGYDGRMPNWSPANPLNGQDVWFGNSGGFITTKANFPVAAHGKVVRVRWHNGTLLPYRA